MAEIGISIVNKLIEVVGSAVIQEVCLIWGYRSQLNALKDTFMTIRHVMLDVESKVGQLGHEQENYILRLKNAIYDADDLFDKFHTLAELKKLNKGGKLSKKVRDFFSPRKNSLCVAYTMSKEIKEIRNKLDTIASDHNTFGFNIDSQPIRNTMEETSSYVYKDDVVGREDDVKKVVNMLLDSNYEERVSFLSIVGIGGLGKTTLAQLVFNDDRVKSEFSLRLWISVSDENPQNFDVKKILTNILNSESGDNHDGFTMDLIQRKIRDLLGRKKFLIVLDNLWNEDRNKWLDLKKFLMMGGIESRVLVTTRSAMTASVVSDESDNSKKYKYELKELSLEDSWRLFKLTAFGENEKDTHDANYSELVELGKKIVVEKCSNIPLAIRVVGTLLYGQNENKWRSFQEYGFDNINDRENKIMSILKFSYDNLKSPLKACFVYCSLFPKGFRIEKDNLIRLWMAQGYVSFNVGQSLDEVAEEYFSTLLQRYFFQEMQMNEVGRVASFKIHDLIHDLAQKLAGKDVMALHSSTRDFGDDVHHIFHLGNTTEESLVPKCKIRSYVRDDFKINFLVVNIVDNWNFLRTLDLHNLDIQTLPDSIDKLLHLRYLDLSRNFRLQRLPDSVTKLYNLQTLDLKFCTQLEELPMNFAKLVNLRHLDIYWCLKLSSMPSGLGKLSCLCVLTDFVAANDGLGSLESLQALTNLRGSLRIRITGNSSIANKSERIEEKYLRRMKHLEILEIRLLSDENHESLLERLEPPSFVKVLEVHGYNGSRLPTDWYGQEGTLATLLPNLVRVQLHNCSTLVHLPSLSKLLHLKSLSLFVLDELEYMEDTAHEDGTSTFFPSLEHLKLNDVNNLKGWWEIEDVTSNVCQPSFIKLSELNIYNCGNLASFPNCPRLEKLTLQGVNEGLLRSLGKEEGLINLKDVEIGNFDYLKSLPRESLTRLCINNDSKLESFAGLGETRFRNCLSLRSLTIRFCGSLSFLNGEGFEHLTSLESLELVGLPRLVFSGQWKDTDNNNDVNNDNGILWRSLEGSLKSLTFMDLKIKILPGGLRYLKSLQNLELRDCENLEYLPESTNRLSSLRSLLIKNCMTLKSLPGNIRELSSLQFLHVENCPLLTERLRDKDGGDWLNIRHIHTVVILED